MFTWRQIFLLAKQIAEQIYYENAHGEAPGNQQQVFGSESRLLVFFPHSLNCGHYFISRGLLLCFQEHIPIAGVIPDPRGGSMERKLVEFFSLGKAFSRVKMPKVSFDEIKTFVSSCGLNPENILIRKQKLIS